MTSNWMSKYWKITFVAFGIFMFIKPVVCILILGLLFFLPTAESILFQIKVQKKGIKSVGQIVPEQSGQVDSKNPLIEFTTSAGELIKERPLFHSTVETDISDPYEYSASESVYIVYDPDNPTKFILAGYEEHNYIIGTVLILISLSCITVSICDLLGFIDLEKYQN